MTTFEILHEQVELIDFGVHDAEIIHQPDFVDFEPSSSHILCRMVLVIHSWLSISDAASCVAVDRFGRKCGDAHRDIFRSFRRGVLNPLTFVRNYCLAGVNID